MLPSYRRFLDDESGATGTEYILIAAIVSIAAFTTFSFLERTWTGAGVFRAQDLVILLGEWGSG